jgi:hypothetical protein
VARDAWLPLPCSATRSVGLAQWPLGRSFCVVSGPPDLEREPLGVLARPHAIHGRASRSRSGPSPGRMWRWVKTGCRVSVRVRSASDGRRGRAAGVGEVLRTTFVWFYAVRKATWLDHRRRGGVYTRAYRPGTDLKEKILKLVTFEDGRRDMDRRKESSGGASWQRLRPPRRPCWTSQDVRRWKRAQRRARSPSRRVVVLPRARIASVLTGPPG